MSTESSHSNVSTLITTGWSRIATLTLAGFIAASVMVLSASSALAIVNPLMSERQSSSSDLAPFTKWTSVLERFEEQQADAGEKCIGKDCMNQKWEELLTELEGKDVATQVDAVNKFFNAITYITDQRNYGVSDYWQTPYELFERGGDCEDYAIAKYISLKRLGVSESEMHILIVRDKNLGGIIHAILEVDVDGEAKILDNQAKVVKPVASIFRYNPVFAINEREWWAYNK